MPNSHGLRLLGRGLAGVLAATCVQIAVDHDRAASEGELFFALCNAALYLVDLLHFVLLEELDRFLGLELLVLDVFHFLLGFGVHEDFGGRALVKLVDLGLLSLLMLQLPEFHPLVVCHALLFFFLGLLLPLLLLLLFLVRIVLLFH